MATSKMDTSNDSKNAGETSEFDVYEADLKDDELKTDDKSIGTNDYEEITVESGNASNLAEEEIIEEEIEIVTEDNDDDDNSAEEDDDIDSSANNSSVWEGDLSTPIIINPADIPFEEREFLNTLILCGGNDNNNITDSNILGYSINFPTSTLGYDVTPSAEYEASYGENKDEGDKSKKSSKITKKHKKKKDALKGKSSQKNLVAEEELTGSTNPTSNDEPGKVSKRKSSKKKLLGGDIEKNVRKQSSSKKKLLDKDDDITSPKTRSSKVKSVKTHKSDKAQKSGKSKEDQICLQDDENDLSLFGLLEAAPISSPLFETLGGSSSSFPLLDLLDRPEDAGGSMHNSHKSLSYLDNNRKSKRKSTRKSRRRESEVEKSPIGKGDMEKSPKGQSKKGSLAKNSSTHSTTEQRHSKKGPLKHGDDSRFSTTTKGKKKTPPEDGSSLPAEAPLPPSTPLNPQEFPSLEELLSSQEGRQPSSMNPPSMASHSASHSDSRSHNSGPAPPSVSSEEFKGEQSMNQGHQQQQDADPDAMYSPSGRRKKMFASKRRTSYRTNALMEGVDEGEASLLGGPFRWSPRTPRASLLLKNKMGSLRHLISSNHYHGLEGEESSVTSGSS
jgi:hypothetical protein